MFESPTRRGRPSTTMLEAAYLKGVEDGEKNTGPRYDQGFDAGFKDATERFYQATRFLLFERRMSETKQAEEHQTVDERARPEAGH